MFSCLDMKRTTDSKTESKLDTSLEPSVSKKTTELKFTDYSINKFKPDYKDKKKKTYPLPGGGIKGLKLNCIKISGNKFFIQNFWFNGKPDYWTVGEFRLGPEGQPPLFGKKQCEEKVYEIAKEHTNDRGLWIKDPKITEKDKETKITKSQFKNSQKKNY